MTGSYAEPSNALFCTLTVPHILTAHIRSLL